MCRILPRLAILGVLVVALGASTAAADEIVYLPTVLSVPARTSYVTTGYLSPATTLYSPTLYYPTSYLGSAYYPTSYVSTAYYRPRGLFSRWRPIYSTTAATYYDLTPTVYYPTSYATIYPTTTSVTSPLVATSSVLYDPCVLPSSASVVGTPTVVSNSSRSGSGTGGTTQTPPRSVQSEPRGNGETGTGGERGVAEPPFDFESTPTPERSGSGNPPDRGLGTPLGGDSARNGQGDSSRTAYRPAPTEMRPSTTALAPNALRGEVVSGTDARAQGNVKVVFSDLQQRYKDREKTSDAQGRFDVVLPSGDWAVSVVESDGKTTPYGTITSAGGRFYDERDRLVSSLRINH
jgi:hypothetical protein